MKERKSGIVYDGGEKRWRREIGWKIETWKWIIRTIMFHFHRQSSWWY